MNTARALGLMLGVVGTVLVAPLSAKAAPGVVYHLRPGSTVQDACFGTCVCGVPEAQPLRGTFVLSPSTPDPVFQNFTMDDVRFRAPTLGVTIVGSGTYQFADARPGMERMSLDLSIQGNPALHGVMGRRVHAPTVVIDTAITLPVSACMESILVLRATPLRSDWNADGASTTVDVFAFLGSWFAGDGDADEDGVTTLRDVFEFVEAWFTGA